MTRHVGGVAVGGLQPWNTRRADDYADMRAAHATWIRADLNWAHLEQTSGGSFHWELTDPVVYDVVNRGMRLLAVMHGVPDWANGATGDYGMPTDLSRWTNYAYRVAARYIPLGVVDYEIGNEVNLPHDGWGPPASAGATYVAQMLAPIVAGIRQASAELGTPVNIILGSMAPTDWTGGTDQATMLADIYTAGGRLLFDNIAWHPYIDVSVDTVTSSDNFNADVTALRAILDANADTGKLIWGTEFGEPTITGTGVTEADQATLVTDAFNHWATLDRVGPLFWYSARDSGTSPTDREQHFGVLLNDGTPKAAYTALTGSLVIGGLLAQTLGQVVERDVASAPLRTKTVGLLLVVASVPSRVTATKTGHVGQASETCTARRLSPHLNRTAETDSARPVSAHKRTVVGRAAELGIVSVGLRGATSAGLLLAITASTTRVPAVKTAHVGQAVEAGSAHPIPAPVRNVAESDAARAVTARKTLAAARVAEVGTAQPVTRVKTDTADQATETSIARPVGHTLAATVGRASEASTAATVRRTLVRVAETDAARTVTSSKRHLLPQVVKTDAARAIQPLKVTTPIGQATELDVASAALRTQTVGLLLVVASVPSRINAVKTAQIGLAVEAGTAQAAGAHETVSVAQAAETDTARTVARVQSHQVAPASEVGTPSPHLTDQTVGLLLVVATAPTRIHAAKTAPVGQATETGAAGQYIQILPPHHYLVPQAAETSTATAAAVRTSIPVPGAAETGAAASVRPLRTEALTRAVGVDTARPVAAARTYPVGRCTETNAAQSAAPAHVAPVGRATEAGAATASGHGKTVPVGTAVSVNRAAVMFLPPIRTMHTAAEVDAALPVSAQGGRGLLADVIARVGPSRLVAHIERPE